MSWMEWYQALNKPNWTPSPAVIGTIWQILYPIILVTFGWVFWKTFRGQLPLLVALPFAINLLANLLFTWIQFGLRSLPGAALDISIVWLTIPWMMWAIWPYSRGVALAQIPYGVWVSIALVLQMSITAKNPW